MRVFRHRIEWFNPYAAPPDAAPRVLAEGFSQDSNPPEGFPQHTLGGGYSHSIACLTPPSQRRLSQPQLANMRRKRLRRRMEKRFPMFAEQMIADKIVANSAYYDGLTDPGVEARRNAALDEYAASYTIAIENIGRVFVYADEPEVCRISARKMRIELGIEC